MAKIGKPIVRRVTTTKVDPRTGERRTLTSERWYIEIRVDGQNKRCPGYTDKRQTERLANRLEDFLAVLAEREGPESLHTRTLTELRDLMDSTKPRLTMTELVTKFERMLRDKKTAEESIKTKAQRVRVVIDSCDWKRPADIRKSDVVACVAKLRDDNKLSRQTASHYMAAVKHFAAWLKDDDHLEAGDRLEHNPLEKMTIPGVTDADRKHVRRVLTEGEFAKLLAAARSSTKRSFKLSGPDRMMLYAVAAYTGFRAAELHSMTPTNLTLQGEAPVATVAAGYTKNKKDATNPLPAQLVALLLPWLEGKDKDKPLWPGKTWHEQGAKMLREDLAAAKIPYKDAKGHAFDFHALRAQFITNLALNGVHPAVAQVLARHSRPELTLNVYTKLGLDNKAEAVNKLPALPGEFVAQFVAERVSR